MLRFFSGSFATRCTALDAPAPPVHPYPPLVAWTSNCLAMACSCAPATGSCGAIWRAAALTASNTPKRSRNVAGCTMGGMGAKARDDGATDAGRVVVQSCRQSRPGNRHGCTVEGSAHGSDHAVIAASVNWKVARSLESAYTT